MLKSATKIWLIVIAVFLFLAVGGFVLKAVLFPVHVAKTVLNTGTNIIDKTLDANNVIFNYENFKDMYNNSKAQVMNIVNTQKTMQGIKDTYGEPKTWSKDIRSDFAFQQSNLDGFMMQYQSIVKQYNSDSSKLNRKIFKDNKLPSELPLDYKELQ